MQTTYEPPVIATAPMVRAVYGEVILMVCTAPSFTPTAARATANRLLRAADEAERGTLH